MPAPLVGKTRRQRLPGVLNQISTQQSSVSSGRIRIAHSLLFFAQRFCERRSLQLNQQPKLAAATLYLSDLGQAE
jgi:hypothetical protein